MLVPYSSMSPDSKVWIYQSDRKILNQELNLIRNRLQSFCDDWMSHGKPVKSSFKLSPWFICFFIDESVQQISGCSIDSSVTIIQAIQNEYDLNFFNRMNIVFIEEKKTKILSLVDFKKCIKPDIMIYNNMITVKKEFEENRLIPVKDSWLNQYI